MTKTKYSNVGELVDMNDTYRSFIEWDTSSAYDFTLNLEHASVDNVAAAFCSELVGNMMNKLITKARSVVSNATPRPTVTPPIEPFSSLAPIHSTALSPAIEYFA